eukprot:scaffold149527_cov30-Tisochrysis_lutea.AAC.2
MILTGCRVLGHHRSDNFRGRVVKVRTPRIVDKVLTLSAPTSLIRFNLYLLVSLSSKMEKVKIGLSRPPIYSSSLLGCGGGWTRPCAAGRCLFSRSNARGVHRGLALLLASCSCNGSSQRAFDGFSISALV